MDTYNNVTYNECSNCRLEDICKYKSSKIELEKKVGEVTKGDLNDMFSPIKVSVNCNKYVKKDKPTKYLWNIQ